MHWRKGKLVVSGPRSYAAHGSQDRQLVLRIPLVIFNDGPKPIVIEDLRLVFLHEVQPAPLEYCAMIDAFRTENVNEKTDRRLATQFAVPGRQTVSSIFEFQREPGTLLFEPGKYDLELQARTDNSSDWTALVRFPLYANQAFISQMNSILSSYNNYPAASISE